MHDPAAHANPLQAWFFPLFVVVFPAMWLGMTMLLSRMSGWTTLADRFLADEPPSGERFRLVSGSMGRFLPVNYGSCLFVTVNDRGFYLSIMFLFRLGSPALFIPWSEVEATDEMRLLFRRCALVTLRSGWPRIWIRGRAGECIRAAHAAASRPILTSAYR
jgi:hypothetical protein